MSHRPESLSPVLDETSTTQILKVTCRTLTIIVEENVPNLSYWVEGLKGNDNFLLFIKRLRKRCCE